MGSWNTNNGGYHYDLGKSATFWCAEGNSGSAYGLVLGYDGDYAGLSGYVHSAGFSIRCLKD